MNILLSNDDGYNETRLHILKEELEKYATVYVSAPKKQMSGASTSITIRKDIPFEVIDDKTIIVDGTPSDSTFLGLSYFKDIHFDLVVSGINKGHNEAKDILFSGTIGAAMIGALADINALAFSAEDDDLDILKEKTKYIVSYIFNKELYKDFLFLNINYPHKNHKEGIGIKVGRIYNTPKNEYLIKSSENTYRTEPRIFVKDDDIDSDRYLTNHGYYSISPLKPNFFDKESIEKLEKLIK